MESIIAIICIVFIIIITYAIVQGNNLTKFHKYNCHTVYIPDNINLEQAFQRVNNLSLNALKKKARELGASKQFIEKYYKDEDKKYLKSYIIQQSISDDNILFNDITEDIELRENIKKREYCRSLVRDNITDSTCPTEPSKLEDYSRVVIPLPKTRLEEEHYFIENEFIKPEDIINLMREDQEEQENVSFLLDNSQ